VRAGGRQRRPVLQVSLPVWAIFVRCDDRFALALVDEADGFVLSRHSEAEDARQRRG